MNLDIVDAKRSRTLFERYVAPDKVRYWYSDGAYRQTHLYDTLLQRDVIYCAEHLWIAERERGRPDTVCHQMLKEARIGAWGHPHIPPTFDAGTDSNDGLFYFTRPLPRTSLSFLFQQVEHAVAQIEILDTLLAGSEFPLAPEVLRVGRRDATETLERLTLNGCLREVQRSVRLRMSPLQLPDKAQVEQVLAEARRRLEASDSSHSSRDDSQPATDDWTSRLHRTATTLFIDTCCQLNQIQPTQIVREEQLIVPNLRTTAVLVQQACSAVACAHERQVWHRNLSPRSVSCDEHGSHAEVTSWGNAHVPDHDSCPLDLDLPMAEYHDAPRGCRKEGPQVDIFGLGRVLSFLLHEPSDELPRDISRLRIRKVYETEQTDLADRLNHVCNCALQFAPEDRHPTVEEFAADIERCLCGATA